MTPQPQQYKITDDLSKAKQGDWIEGVGDISTYYEEKFVRRWVEAIRSRSAPSPTLRIKDKCIEDCPHSSDTRDAAIRNAAYESEYVKTLVGNAFRAGEMKGTKDGREKVLDELRNTLKYSGVISLVESLRTGGDP